MKKSKLVLHRETVRLLSAPALMVAHGASVDPGGCTNDWGCTGTSIYTMNSYMCPPETYACPNTTMFGQTACTPCEM